MDTSTLSIVFLLVIAATLASYALSHLSSIRGAIGGFGLAATSIGTTMLLTAAAIVVLTFVFKGPLWRPNLGTEQQLRETAAASKEISPRGLAASALSTGAASTSSATASHTARTRRDPDEPGGSPASMRDQRQSQKAASTPSTTELDPDPLHSFKEDDPWAATRCVYVYNPGSDTTQWKIENGCDVPVGVVVSNRPLILPAKHQRPITLDEQTVYGQNIQYLACFVAISAARHLIGAPSEERSKSSWREQFESARVNDGCLLRLPS